MMNTTHIFNKATQRYVNANGYQLHCEANGLNAAELLRSTAERFNLLASEGTDPVAVTANLLSIGIEIGKLLCDPATHLAEH